MNTLHPYRYKSTHLKTGEYVVVTESIKNGLIELKPLDKGKIIHHQNQVNATVWFWHFGHYISDSISKALEIETGYGKNGRMNGLSLELSKGSFAIVYDFKEHDDIAVNEEKAMKIPFFRNKNKKEVETNSKINIGNGVFQPLYAFYLRDIIDEVEDGFYEWVHSHMKFRKVTKKEKENGEYPDSWDTVLTDQSNKEFYEEKEKLEIAFARATGVFYEFTGGLLINE